jgi:predicted dehydrogenase
MIDQGRRSFLQQSSVAGASALGSTLAAGAMAARAAQAAAANEQLVLGIIGCGGRGAYLAREFVKLKNVRISHCCDPDAGQAEKVARSLSDSGGGDVQIVGDPRRVLDTRLVDAVIVATPDHWHAPAAILACDAGKHVYVEKPCSHNVREGRLLVEAARRNQRVVQTGTQSRSDNLVNHAIALLRQGAIGDVLVAKAWNVQKRSNIGHAAASEPPSGFDYDMWVGPAPLVPFQANRHHYTWHWWHAFGTGDMGNDGIHELDIARWGLGVETHPSRVSGTGGKYYFDDDQQFPDTQYVEFEYPGDGQVGNMRQLVYEQRIWSPYRLHGVDNGCAFYGTDGWLLVSKRGILKLYGPGDKPRDVPESEQSNSSHFQNFADCIREGTRPRAEAEIGHRSATLSHLGNIATRLGRGFRFDPEHERVPDDADAQALLSREYRPDHWAVPHGV